MCCSLNSSSQLARMCGAAVCGAADRHGGSREAHSFLRELPLGHLFEHNRPLSIHDALITGFHETRRGADASKGPSTEDAQGEGDG